MNKKNEKKFAKIIIAVVTGVYLVMLIVVAIERSSPDFVPNQSTYSHRGCNILALLTAPVWVPLTFIYRYFDDNNSKFRSFSDIDDEIAYSKYEDAVNNHFVYTVLQDLPKSKFVLMLDEITKKISPAVYTKKNDKISVINRNAEYTVFEQIELANNDFSGDYTFIRTCRIRDKKTGEQVLFTAVPNRKTEILAYSDSTHNSNKTVTFGKFRIFCFVESANNPYTDLFVDSEKVPLQKSTRKGVYFIGLDEVLKKNFTNNKT